ncbi:MAG: hypothetical protein CK528_11830 [Alcaligenaceae bacterium]|nr:MAG: hypothetical protein CK528_11830 [Alcaligenaceae bacterium]
MRIFQKFTSLLAAALLFVCVGCAQTTEPLVSPAVGAQTTEPPRSTATEVQSTEPLLSPATVVQSYVSSESPASVVPSVEPILSPAPVVQPVEVPSGSGAVTMAAAIKYDAAALRTAAILLAGQQPVTGLPPAIAQSPRWATFAKEVSENWTLYSQKIADPMSRWALAELPVAPETVFYPFSGPDFVTVHQLFPTAQRYVMMAMQNAERPLDLANISPELLEPSLGVLTSAWKHFGDHGFYVTEYLEKYLYSTRANIGASTFIVSFLSLQGFEIERVVPIQVAADGTLQELSPDTPRWRSVRIQASKQGKLITVDYLKIDLSNEGLQAAPQNLMLINTLTTNPVLFKAASHLPQNVGFSMIANQILERSPLIVQDETGIKYTNLTQSYQVALFGKFVAAHHAFSSYHVDLAKAFAQRDDTKPLNFRFGYFKDGNYALMIATRK